MNLFTKYLKEITNIISKDKNLKILLKNEKMTGIIIETPPEKFNFDMSSNIAMILAKINKQNPNKIAGQIKSVLDKKIKDFSKIEIAGPGFLNIQLSKKAWCDNIKYIFKNKKKYGSNNSRKKYNIEFVSANPTGPLHVGHCRGAIYGDVISNLLTFNGNKVIKEFYVNDYGNQINIFAESVIYRIKEIINNETFPDGKNLYPGAYIIDIAKKIINKNKKTGSKKLNLNKKLISKYAIKYSMDLIKLDLNKLGVKHDFFFYETDIVKKNLIKKCLNQLKNDGLIFEGYLNPPKGEDNKNWKKTKKLIFRSSKFGDDSDRSLQKDDGSWTYFANDLAYHSDKVNRKFDHIINVLGADHTGYIKRISSAVQAISKNKTQFTCKITQLVKLFKNGEPFKMSKRSGEFISVNDLLNEVNKDSIRFMMLHRSNDVEIDFDFKKVLEKNKDNPVFYVQYCYARINSIFRTLKIDPSKKSSLSSVDFKINNFEEKLLKKIIEWPKVVEVASNKKEPHRIPFYLYELSTLFHSYWSKGNEDPNYKFIKNGNIKNKVTLKIFQIISIILKNGMFILGVSLPRKM